MSAPDGVPQRLGGLAIDLRHALRGIRKSPGLAGGVILLALGIGTSTAMFILASVLEGARPSFGIPVAAAALLGALTLFAAWIPARRGAGVDPMTALRNE